MNMKKITSLTSLISFLVLLLNSVVLYIVPHGRVANWADWRLWGLSKTDWANQHTIIGVLFLIAIFLHIYYNWKPIVFYLKNRAKQLKVFTKDFNIALIVTIICVIGSYYTILPFNWILEFSESIKNKAEVTYGSPPYGRAELSSLKGFASRTSINLSDGLEKLQKAGIKVKNEKQTLIDIATLNKISPQKVFMLMKPVETNVALEKSQKMPAEAVSGTSRKTLEDICKTYDLDINAVMAGFVANKIRVSADMTLRTIAEQNNIGTEEVYALILESAGTSPAPGSATVTPGENKAQASTTGTPSGLGRMTLGEVCQTYNIDLDAAVEKLAGKGITALPGDKMRGISDKHDITRGELYEIIK